jgi:hypothetical protein
MSTNETTGDILHSLKKDSRWVRTLKRGTTDQNFDAFHAKHFLDYSTKVRFTGKELAAAAASSMLHVHPFQFSKVIKDNTGQRCQCITLIRVLPDPMMNYRERKRWRGKKGERVDGWERGRENGWMGGKEEEGEGEEEENSGSGRGRGTGSGREGRGDSGARKGGSDAGAVVRLLPQPKGQTQTAAAAHQSSGRNRSCCHGPTRTRRYQSP